MTAATPTPSPKDAPRASDDKDWTWVLQRRCPQCGLEVSTVSGSDLAPAIRQAALPWAAILSRRDVRAAPAPGVWSPLEYGAHVRDVCRIFDERTRLILDQPDPHFADWDQDQAAREGDYAAQDPRAVAGDLAAAAATLVGTYARISGDAWDRPGRRSNGSSFTTLTLGRYLLHDLVHHLWDVRA